MCSSFIKIKLKWDKLKMRKMIMPKVAELLVGEKGFEPSTPWSQTRCATRLRYSPRKHGYIDKLAKNNSF